MHNKNKLSIKQSIICIIGGLVRGAISFALVEEINTPNRKILISTVLGLVCITTLVISIILPILNNIFNFKKINSSNNEIENTHKKYLHVNYLSEIENKNNKFILNNDKNNINESLLNNTKKSKH